MRGTPVFATLIMGLPVAAFAITWLVTDGAPLRAPGHGSAASALAVPEPAGLPEPSHPSVSSSDTPPGAVSVAGPAGAAVAGEAVSAGEGSTGDASTGGEWDRLVARAAGGDRDALMFLTLMGMTDRHPLGRRPSP